MVEKRYSFPSANGLHNINTVIWVPENKDIIGIVQIVHGMCEYIYRYKDFASFLCSKGFVVCGNDHAGHGDSIKNTYGYMGEEGDTTLLKDVHKVTAYIKTQYTDVPLFLLGHSMGSFVSRIFVSYYANDIDGIIISGTNGTQPMLNAGIALTNQMIRMGKGKQPAKIIDKLGFGAFNNQFGKPRTAFDWLSRDTDVVDKYIKDPKCNFIFTYYGYRDLFKIIKSVSSNKWYEDYPKNLPTYIFSGDADPVGNKGKGVAEVYTRLKESGVNNLKITLYRDGRHEMLNEINKNEVYLNILAWLGSQLESRL